MYEYDHMDIKMCDYVYAPSDDSFLLADNLLINPGDRVLEIGTGTGLVALNASIKASKVIATDINPYATECARHNAQRNGIENVQVKEGDLFQPVQGETFDLILFNTPYLPSTEDDAIGDLLDAAWDGGPDGRRVIDRFLNEVKNYLNDGGRVQLVQSSLSDNDKTCHRLVELGFKVEITASEQFFYEEIVVISGFL